MLPEPEDLVQDHLAHLTNILDDLEVEIKGGRAVGLVASVVPDGQVGMLERSLDTDTAGRVKGQHPVEQIESVGVGIGEE